MAERIIGSRDGLEAIEVGGRFFIRSSDPGRPVAKREVEESEAVQFAPALPAEDPDSVAEVPTEAAILPPKPGTTGFAGSVAD